uniref:Uncharacterized protein n=1 Tax=Anguilla anguilla TaxID=7936 RepID=A0A0E9QCC3_ANGAN
MIFDGMMVYFAYGVMRVLVSELRECCRSLQSVERSPGFPA